MIKPYLDLERTGVSYEDRIGTPDAISAAIGRIAINFNDLEKELSSVIAYLLQSGEDIGRIVTADLSFGNKVNLMSALSLARLSGADDTEQLQALSRLCRRAEELRNRILHSSWLSASLPEFTERIKLSSKGRKGFSQKRELMTSAELMDIADFIAYSTTMVDEYFSWRFKDYSSWTWSEPCY